MTVALPILLLALSMQTALAADAGQATVGAGVDYSSGNYGTAFNTNIWDVPFSVGYDADRWSAKLTVPFVNISGASNVIPGIGRVKNNNPHGRGHGRGGSGPTPPPTVTSGTASGLGDVVAKASYGFVRDAAAQFGMDVTGKIKFGTADENKGLGTGKNDYGLGVSAYKGFGALTLFGGVEYVKYGSSTYIPLNNGWDGNLGASYKLGSADTVGAYYYYRQKISDLGYQQSEGTAYWDHKFGANLRLQIYALAGFTDGSPDWGTGANIRYSF